MVSFGNYLLSEERRKLYSEHPAFPDGERLEERLSVVNHADMENWINREEKRREEKDCEVQGVPK